jgi:hypothetical protein
MPLINGTTSASPQDQQPGPVIWHASNRECATKPPLGLSTAQGRGGAFQQQQLLVPIIHTTIQRVRWETGSFARPLFKIVH